jgi:UDP-N-acetylmuramoylalanine--D-glutamate ligase
MDSIDLLVLGGGESGTGAALLAHALGWKVAVSDRGSIQQLHKKELQDRGIAYEENGHNWTKNYSGLTVKSPGIPSASSVVTELKEAGAELISEIEWASRHTRGDIVAITGSNGKTTTTSMTHAIFRCAGMDVCMAGNIGNSMARELAETDSAHWVLEVSSFQLDDICSFRPRVAAILNITADHLDRYGHSLQAYADAKMRIAMNQEDDDLLILPDFDPVVNEALKRTPLRSHIVRFSDDPLQGPASEGAGLNEDQHIRIQLQNREPMELFDLSLPGRHNMYNSMASAIAARYLEVREESIRNALSNFERLPHRLESILSINGVEYINDSKATNVNSTQFALESMSRQTIWIAGGVDKGNDYQELVPIAKEKVKALVCLGKDNDRLIASFKDSIDLIAETDSMQAAVHTAFSIAKKGEAVLLSPACASFDLFESFEDRGQQFVNFVRQL